LWKLTRPIFLPVLGLTSMLTILERQSEAMGWKTDGEPTAEELESRRGQVERVHQSMKFLHKPFQQLTAVLGGGFQHVLLTLELVQPPKEKKPDEESKGDGPPPPGSPAFAEHLKNQIENFYGSKKRSLEEFCDENGIDLPSDFWESSFIHSHAASAESIKSQEQHQRQLFFVLYVEYLLWRAGKAVLDLVLYVDKRKQEGAFKRTKLIFPGSRALYNFIKSAFSHEDMSHEDAYTADMNAGGGDIYVAADFLKKRKDPEHLPPRNAGEKIGNAIRTIPQFFRSDESAFGLRVVAATMTLGIVCYLRETQTFFLDNRLLWVSRVAMVFVDQAADVMQSLIMTAISMSRYELANSRPPSVALLS
jgi:hypothetical protein